MRKLLVCLLALGLLTGCTKYENGKPVDTPAKEEVVKHKETGTLKAALKQFKNGKVEDVTDARKTTGHITVMVKLDPDYGARSQAGGIISNSQIFVKALHQKPKSVTIIVKDGDMKVLQYDLDSKGKVTLDFAHPDIEEYLRKAGYLK
jgi:hypothetical protein